MIYLFESAPGKWRVWMEQNKEQVLIGKDWPWEQVLRNFNGQEAIAYPLDGQPTPWPWPVPLLEETAYDDQR